MANKKQKIILNFKNDAFVNQLASLILSAGKVKVGGLGIFELKKIEEREGWSIKDGSRIKIPARQKITFRPTKKFKDLVQEYDNREND